MIIFLTRPGNQFPIEYYLKSKKSDGVREFIKVFHYGEIHKINNLPVSRMIFTDFEMMDREELDLVSKMYNHFKIKFNFHLDNDPKKIIYRYDLLKILFQKGINQFDVHKLDSDFSKIRFPVFIRDSSNHLGSASRLIKNQKELKTSLFHNIYPRGPILENKAIIIEYINTRNNKGYYNSYSSTKYAGVIYPRYFKYAKKWVVKSRKLIMNPSTIKEGDEYIKGHPHKEWLKKCFEIANIDYGRIDYGKSNDGHLNVWEINTNPLIGPLKREFNKDIKKEWRILTKSKEIFFY